MFSFLTACFFVDDGQVDMFYFFSDAFLLFIVIERKLKTRRALTCTI